MIKDEDTLNKWYKVYRDKVNYEEYFGAVTKTVKPESTLTLDDLHHVTELLNQARREDNERMVYYAMKNGLSREEAVQGVLLYRKGCSITEDQYGEVGHKFKYQPWEDLPLAVASCYYGNINKENLAIICKDVV